MSGARSDRMAADTTLRGAPHATALEYAGSCDLPTPRARFRLHGFVDPRDGKEHLALTLGDVRGNEPVLVRVHSECKASFDA